MYFNAQDGKTIIYYDVFSLYPFICKTGVFPIGHPDIFVGDKCFNLTGVNFEYFHKNVKGLVKCGIIPPEDYFTRFYRLESIINYFFFVQILL